MHASRDMHLISRCCSRDHTQADEIVIPVRATLVGYGRRSHLQSIGIGNSNTTRFPLETLIRARQPHRRARPISRHIRSKIDCRRLSMHRLCVVELVLSMHSLLAAHFLDSRLGLFLKQIPVGQEGSRGHGRVNYALGAVPPAWFSWNPWRSRRDILPRHVPQHPSQKHFPLLFVHSSFPFASSQHFLTSHSHSLIDHTHIG